MYKSPFARHCKNIKEICRNYFNEPTFHYFSHLRIYPEQGYFLLPTNNAWPDHHFLECNRPPGGYHNYDEVNSEIVFPSFDYDRHFGWSEGVVQDAKQRFGLTNLMSITQKFERHLDVFSFDFLIEDAENVYLQRLDKFQKFIHYYRDVGERLIKKNSKNLFKVEGVKPKGLQCNLQSSEELFNAQFTPKYYRLCYHQITIELNASEYKILGLFARGFTASVIGQKLCVSTRTVQTHFNNIKQKHPSLTTQQLIEAYWLNQVL